jgi:hypothetical protein
VERKRKLEKGVLTAAHTRIKKYLSTPRAYNIDEIPQESIVLVISPLVALMQDQIKGLNDMGIKAACLGDDKSEEISLRRETIQSCLAVQNA